MELKIATLIDENKKMSKHLGGRNSNQLRLNTLADENLRLSKSLD